MESYYATVRDKLKVLLDLHPAREKPDWLSGQWNRLEALNCQLALAA